MPPPWFRRFAFAFGIAFATLYVVAVKLDLALFTVYPSISVVLLGTHHSRDSVGPSMGSFMPAMYWYGWTGTAAMGALIFGIGAAFLPERWSRPFRSLSAARGCARIDSRPDAAKIGSAGHFEVRRARLLQLLGYAKRFHTAWTQRRPPS